MARRRRSQYAVLLLLLSSSCAWAANDSPPRSERGQLGSTPCETETIPNAKISNLEAQSALEIIMTEPGSAMTKGNVADGLDGEEVDVVIPGTGERILPASSQDDDTVEEQVSKLCRRSTPSSSPTHQEAAAHITPAPLDPLLAARQDQSQVDQLNARIQSLQQSAQQALQSLSDQSRAVSAASQSLSQSSQELSRQSLSLSSQSSQLANSLQFATITINSLGGALSTAISSGSSAFASCTNSAASELAKASGDAATQVRSALAQATVAREQADQQVQQAQNTAISITQAAAAIVGTFIGSSLLTILLVLLILRVKRTRRRRSSGRGGGGDGDDNNNNNNNGGGGGGGFYGDEKQRPRTRDRPTSYNSMAGAVARDVKGPLPPSARSPTASADFFGGGLGTGTTRVASPPPAGQQGQPLPKLGIFRQETTATATATGGGGQALSTDYVRRANSTERKPVVMKLAEPPPAKKKNKDAKTTATTTTTTTTTSSSSNNNNANNTDETGNNNNNNNSNNNGGGTGSGAAVLRVFPKVDPDPKGLLSVPQQQQQQPQQGRPGSEQQAANLQRWLQTATVSPFGPFGEGGAARASTRFVAPGPSKLATATATAERTTSTASTVWPLQEPMTAYLETPTVETATVARSMSGKGSVRGVVGLPANPRKGGGGS